MVRNPFVKDLSKTEVKQEVKQEQPKQQVQDQEQPIQYIEVEINPKLFNDKLNYIANDVSEIKAMLKKATGQN